MSQSVACSYTLVEPRHQTETKRSELSKVESSRVYGAKRAELASEFAASQQAWCRIFRHNNTSLAANAAAIPVEEAVVFIITSFIVGVGVAVI